MEWVIALLGVGCVFFSAQVVVDYVKYKRALNPKLEQMASARQDLEERVATSEAELEKAREALEPSKAEVERLEEEYRDIHDQVKDELGRQRESRSPGAGPGS